MKEFELTLKLRNNCVKRRRVALGLSPRQLAEHSGVSYPRILEFEGMKVSPVSSCKTGWKPSASKLAKFFGCAEEELFPDAVLAVRQPQIVAEIAAEQALALAKLSVTYELPPTPTELFEVAERDHVLGALLETLTPREQAVLRCHYFQDETLEGTASKFGVGRERIRQIEAKAFRKLRANKLLEVS